MPKWDYSQSRFFGKSLKQGEICITQDSHIIGVECVKGNTIIKKQKGVRHKKTEILKRRNENITKIIDEEKQTQNTIKSIYNKERQNAEEKLTKCFIGEDNTILQDTNDIQKELHKKKKEEEPIKQIKLKFYHQNVESISNKIALIEEQCEKYKPTIVCLTEHQQKKRKYRGNRDKRIQAINKLLQMYTY